MKAARAPDPAGGQPARAMLLLPAVLSSLPVIGSRLLDFARDAAGERGAGKEVHALRLAVQEACTNVIKHGRMSDADRRLAIRFELEGDQLNILISDSGEPFDPGAVDPTLSLDDEPAEGGYGLFLIRSLVDVINYQSAGGTNTLTLGKVLPPEEST